MRAYLTVAALLLLIFGAIGGYLYNKFSALAAQDYTPPPITVAATKARAETWPTTLEAVGTLHAARGVNLASETSGEIIAIGAESGQRVEEGQLLVTLNDSVEQAEKKRLQANLVLAQQLYERDASLLKQKSVPQSQYDRSRADLDAAIASLAENQARLDNKRISAPFAGTIGIIQVKTGDYIESGTPITTLQDLTALEVDFSVPERYYPLLRNGLPLRLQASASERVYTGSLVAVDAAVDAGTRNLALRARLDESDGLLPGMFARIIVDLQQPREVVTIPEIGVTYSLQGDTVWVVEPAKEGKGLVVNPRVVKTGQVRDGRVAILDGLAAGEQLVSVGQNKLHRGAAVVLEENPAPFTQ
ncbi:efflux RND transporter periplasmic adaptor subunit [Mangrovimicrobium sediminis]|uniref:Efflux RND transporter periplasmic adaptor subunit n=1 Tax=Mangrovimicrobium sediminis TaxID=2562682 RepID=A0A4Z0LX37_9GAMM|nr:efflux RND transporter periplasmic adaptor subunit [Haliea sp. SAOS-164]TGD71912.1 efflux RND transporter periplasmic adaptor subunit [Haliea sp. SAOS-164]